MPSSGSARKQFFHAAETRHVQCRGDIEQRRQHENPFAYARMRHLELRRGDALVAEYQQIQVQGARTPAFRTHAACGCLDAADRRQQCGSRQQGEHAGDGIDEVSLLHGPERPRAVQA